MPKNSIFLNDNIVFLMVGGIVVFLIILFFLLENFIPKSSNNGTLVVEIGVGMVIAIIVYRATKKSERKNQEILDTIGPIIQKDNDLSNLREYVLATNLTWNFLSIETQLDELKNISDSSVKTTLNSSEIKKSNVSHSRIIKNDIVIMIDEIYSLDVTKLRNISLIEEILDYLHYLRRYCEHEPGSHWIPHDISELIKKNENIKNQCKKISLMKYGIDNEES